MRLDISMTEVKALIFAAFNKETGMVFHDISFRDYPESLDRLNDEVTAGLLGKEKSFSVLNDTLVLEKTFVEKHWGQIFDDLKKEAIDFKPTTKDPEFILTKVLEDIMVGDRGSRYGTGYGPNRNAYTSRSHELDALRHNNPLRAGPLRDDFGCRLTPSPSRLVTH